MSTSRPARRTVAALVTTAVIGTLIGVLAVPAGATVRPTMLCPGPIASMTNPVTGDNVCVT